MSRSKPRLVGSTGVRASGIITSMVALAMMAAGCASTQSTSIAPQLAIGPTEVVGYPSLTEPVVTATDCASFTAAVTVLPATHQLLLQYAGTRTDPKPVFQQITDAMAVLTTLAPACAPAAVTQIDALDQACDEVIAIYQTDAVGPMAEDSQAALDIMAQRGREAWGAMGLSPAAWP